MGKNRNRARHWSGQQLDSASFLDDNSNEIIAGAVYERYIYVPPSKTDRVFIDPVRQAIRDVLFKLDSSEEEFENAIRLVGYVLGPGELLNYERRIQILESVFTSNNVQFEEFIHMLLVRFRWCEGFFENHLEHFGLDTTQLTAAIEAKFPNQDSMSILAKVKGQWWSKFVFDKSAGYAEIRGILLFLTGRDTFNESGKIRIPEIQY